MSNVAVSTSEFTGFMERHTSLLLSTHLNTWAVLHITEACCSAKDQKVTGLGDSLEANCVALQALKVAQEAD